MKNIEMAKEFAAIRAFQRGDTKRLRPVIDAYKGWLIAQAVKACKRNPSVEFDDIHQAVIVGFIKACHLFDPTKGARISTYASFHIQSQLTFDLMNKGQIGLPASAGNSAIWHHLPRLARKLGLKLNALTSEQIDFIAEELGVFPDRVAIFAQYLSAPAISLDEDLNDPDSVHRYMPAVEPDAINVISSNESTKLIFQAVQNLPERERLIIELMHPSDGKEPITLEVMSQMLGVSSERIRQLKDKAYSRIKSDLEKQKIKNIDDMMEVR